MLRAPKMIPDVEFERYVKLYNFWLFEGLNFTYCCNKFTINFINKHYITKKVTLFVLKI